MSHDACRTPHAACLNVERTTAVSLAAQVVDLLFLCDIVLNFLTAFKDSQGLIEYRFTRIAKR
jgi:hypothetical protein